LSPIEAFETTSIKNPLMGKSRSALKDDFAEPIGRRKRGNMTMEVRPSFTPIK
jgi:hypothetical protein